MTSAQRIPAPLETFDSRGGHRVLPYAPERIRLMLMPWLKRPLAGPGHVVAPPVTAAATPPSSVREVRSDLRLLRPPFDEGGTVEAIRVERFAEALARFLARGIQSQGTR